MAENSEPDDLLNALESIKSLLAESETKLSAAKKSISEASPKTSLPLPEVDESFDIEEDNSFNVPVLSEIVIPAADEGGKATVDIEVLKAFLDEMQKSIEKNMRDTIMKSVVQAETDIKRQLRAYLNQLRKMLNDAS